MKYPLVFACLSLLMQYNNRCPVLLLLTTVKDRRSGGYLLWMGSPSTVSGIIFPTSTKKKSTERGDVAKIIFELSSVYEHSDRTLATSELKLERQLERFQCLAVAAPLRICSLESCLQAHLLRINSHQCCPPRVHKRSGCQGRQVHVAPITPAAKEQSMDTLATR